MALLNAFVADYIPMELRHGRDFTGPRGWCDLGNAAIRFFENEGLLERDRTYTVPIYIDHTYRPREIFLPTDFKRVLDVYEYDDENRHYETIWRNNKLRLTEDYEETSDYDATDRTVGASSDTTFCYTSPEDMAADDVWKGYGVWFQTGAISLTDNFSPYDCRLVWHSDYDNNNAIYWTPALSSIPALGKRLWLFNAHLMMVYDRRYDTLSAPESEIPVSDALEYPLSLKMCELASPAGSKQRRAYNSEFKEALVNLGNEAFTPSPQQARPKARPWPSSSLDSEGTTHEWTGD